MKSKRSKDIIITSRNRQEWKEYFKGLLVEKRKEDKDRTQQNVVIVASPVKVKLEEVKRRCVAFKNKKATGLENIPGELLKYRRRKLYEHHLILFQEYLTKAVPEKWNMSYENTISTKGIKLNLKTMVELLLLKGEENKSLKNKIQMKYQDMEAEEQAKFRTERSTVDHIFTLSQLIEKRIARHSRNHLLFVDLKKAYPLLRFGKHWREPKLTKIMIEKQLISQFKVTKGCLSLSLFKIYFEEVLRQWKNTCKNMGIIINNIKPFITLPLLPRISY